MDLGCGGMDIEGCGGTQRDVVGRMYWDVLGCVGMWLSCAPVPRRAAVRPWAAIFGLRVLLPRQLRGRGRCRGGALPGRLRQRLRVRPGAVPDRGELRPPERLPLPPRPPAVRPGAEHPPALQPVVSPGGWQEGGKSSVWGAHGVPCTVPVPAARARGAAGSAPRTGARRSARCWGTCTMSPSTSGASPSRAPASTSWCRSGSRGFGEGVHGEGGCSACSLPTGLRGGDAADHGGAGGVWRPPAPQLPPGALRHRAGRLGMAAQHR